MASKRANKNRALTVSNLNHLDQNYSQIIQDTKHCTGTVTSIQGPTRSSSEMVLRIRLSIWNTPVRQADNTQQPRRDLDPPLAASMPSPVSHQRFLQALFSQLQVAVNCLARKPARRKLRTFAVWSGMFYKWPGSRTRPRPFPVFAGSAEAVPAQQVEHSAKAFPAAATDRLAVHSYPETCCLHVSDIDFCLFLQCCTACLADGIQTDAAKAAKQIRQQCSESTLFATLNWT